MVPIGKKSPGRWVLVTVSTEQLSAVIGFPQVTVAPHWPEADCTFKTTGRPEIVGASSSITVTVKL